MREGGRKGGREEGREGGREGGRKGGREDGKEGGSKRVFHLVTIRLIVLHRYAVFIYSGFIINMSATMVFRKVIDTLLPPTDNLIHNPAVFLLSLQLSVVMKYSLILSMGWWMSHQTCTWQWPPIPATWPMLYRKAKMTHDYVELMECGPEMHLCVSVSCFEC